MATVPLTGGAYQARSVIASAQRSLNLYAEPLPQTQGEPAPMAHYPTPGLTALGAMPENHIRALKQTTTGGIYCVAGTGVYHVDPTHWTGTQLGSVATIGTPVSMQDNTETLVIVDGSANGWKVDLASNTFAQINDPYGQFVGADRVDYLDGYLLFNHPGTPAFYSSLNFDVSFDPFASWFANKSGFADQLITLAVAKKEIWLLGERTSEVWFDAGSADFPFAQMPGVFIDQGCRAKYSVATYDDAVYWLGYNRAGQGIVLTGANYQTKRISTFAIESEFTTYPRIDDAIGFVYSLRGHAFYVLTFPAADKTYVYDITTGEWHEWKWIDNDGQEHRHRANCAYAINGMVVVGDWENGNLYQVDPAAYTDAGQPIKRVRSFPHLVNEANRMFYREFIANLESGNPAGAPASNIVTLLSCAFTAPDGTALASYSNPNDTNASFTLVSGSGGVIEGGAFTGPAGDAAEYKTPSLSSADYTLQFRAIPSTYAAASTGSLYAIARTTGVGTGYRVMVSGDGTQYHLTLDAEGGGTTETLAMGTIPSGWFIVTMTLTGVSISVTAQRQSDGLWLQPSGIWTSTQAPALTLTDGTWSAAGMVMIGGSW